MKLIVVRENAELLALQVTDQVKDSQDQQELREFITGVERVELFPSRITVSTLGARYDFAVGDWALKTERGFIRKVAEADFRANYEIVKE